MPELGKCRLCQRPTKKRSKTSLDSTWQYTEPLLGPAIHKLKPDTCSYIYAQRVHFRQLPVLRVGHEVTLELKFRIPLCFPCLKTRNPAPTSNQDSHFPPLFSAQIPNITAKKSQIPHPAKPIGDPLNRVGNFAGFGHK